MKAEERDRLLVRLDERTNNIYRLAEAQEKHLEKLNGQIVKIVVEASKVAITVARQGERVETNRRNIKWIMGIIGSLIVGGCGTAGITKLLELW